MTLREFYIRYLDTMPWNQLYLNDELKISFDDYLTYDDFKHAVTEFLKLYGKQTFLSASITAEKSMIIIKLTSTDWNKYDSNYTGKYTDIVLTANQ